MFFIISQKSHTDYSAWAGKKKSPMKLLHDLDFVEELRK